MAVNCEAQASIKSDVLGLALAHDNLATSLVFRALFAEWLPGDYIEVTTYMRALPLAERIKIIDGLRALVVEMEREP